MRDWAGPVGRVLLGAALLSLAIGGVAPMIARRYWLADLVTFVIPQMLALAIAGLVVAGLLRSRPMLAAAIAIVLLDLFWLVRPGPISAPPQAAEADLRAMTYNVLFYNQRFDLFADYVRRTGPAIIGLQEAVIWESRLGELGDLYPYRSTDLVNDPSGIVLLSRYPIRQIGLFRPMEMPRRARAAETAIDARLDVGGRPLQVFVIHPPSPRNSLHWHDRNFYLDALAARIAAVGSAMPVIVLGDFNTGTWSANLRDFARRSGLVDAAAGRLAPPTRIPREFGLPPWLGAPVDHAFVSPGIGIGGLRAGPDLRSDHLPLVVDMRLPEAG